MLDNTNEGHNFNVTAQLRKSFDFGLSAMLGYSYTEAKNNLKSTEIASVLWQSQPVQGNPNNPELSHSEFGQRHRIVGGATYVKAWSPSLRTSIGLFVEVAEGNRFAGAGGNRYSFIYSGDVNGDGHGRQRPDLHPSATRARSCSPTAPPAAARTSPRHSSGRRSTPSSSRTSTSESHRGEIAERSGALNPWYNNVDLRILQDFSFGNITRHTFQLSLDVLNVGNLISSDWGVRKVASSAATSPLRLTGFDRRERSADLQLYRPGGDVHRRSERVLAVAGAARAEILLRVGS